MSIWLLFIFIYSRAGLSSNCADEGQLSCGESSSFCYNPAFICDGAVECQDTGKDEMDCDSRKLEKKFNSQRSAVK